MSAKAGGVSAQVISEKSWHETVVATAKAFGWRVYHTHDSRRSEAGFPDLVMARERVIFAELKTERGRLTAAQEAWLEALAAAGAATYCWRPSDWPAVEAELQVAANPGRVTDLEIREADLAAAGSGPRR